MINGVKKKGFFCQIFLLSYLFMGIAFVWAALPPLPAHQNIGINDGLFNNMVEEDCRFCHENPDQFPVEDETIPNRHHLLIDTVIPDPTDAPFGTPGELYECFTCHDIDTSTGEIVFIVERDCLVCHIQDPPSELTVHHRTDLAQGTLPQGPDCQACHGSLVDNIEDGHYIPTHEPSAITPKRSGGTGLPLNDEGNGRGACTYCHSTGTGDPSIPGVDPDSGVLVYSTKDTHHNTGFGFDATKCDWCHRIVPPSPTPDLRDIRTCENCHAPGSIHSIQTDSNGDGIINDEVIGYGHIGGSDDCQGCHDFSALSAPGTGPVVPYINTISASVLTAGIESTVTLTGSAFTNISEGVELTSNVIVTADDGSLTELIPDALNESTLTVTIPGTLATGTYRVKAVKLDKFSNPMVISVEPDVWIADVTCNKKKKILFIYGTGFSEKAEGTDAYINVLIDDQIAEIISWTDTTIKSSVSPCPKHVSITVNSLFGSDTHSYGSKNGRKPDKPCKGKKC
jgi:hypothetical protein